MRKQYRRTDEGCIVLETVNDDAPESTLEIEEIEMLGEADFEIQDNASMGKVWPARENERPRPAPKLSLWDRIVRMFR